MRIIAREAVSGWKQPVTSRRLRRLRTLDRMPISSHSSEPAIDPQETSAVVIWLPRS